MRAAATQDPEGVIELPAVPEDPVLERLEAERGIHKVNGSGRSRPCPHCGLRPEDPPRPKRVDPDL